MAAVIEERVDKLELLLGQFIVQTNLIITRMERDTAVLKNEMTAFKEEMAVFKGEMAVFKDEMTAFREEMQAERTASKIEMRDFKAEMQAERAASKIEMRDFKAEMQAERAASKIEMRDFKAEMQATVHRLELEHQRMNKQWGELANRLGTLVEDVAAPNIPEVARTFFGCDELVFFGIRVKKRHLQNRNILREFDVIAVYDSKIIINETKVAGRVDYIDQFAQVVTEWRNYFPEHQDKQLLPVFSSLYLDESIVNYLTKQRIYAMAMHGDTMTLLNSDKLLS